MNRATAERIAALLQRILDAGTWHHSALEIDVHRRNEDGEDLEKAIRAMLNEIDARIALRGNTELSWDDVDELRATAEDYAGEPAQETAPALRSIADRIAALLPPREEKP